MLNNVLFPQAALFTCLFYLIYLKESNTHACFWLEQKFSLVLRGWPLKIEVVWAGLFRCTIFRGLIGRSYDDDATQKDKKVLPYKARAGKGEGEGTPLAVVFLCFFCVCVKFI